MAAPTCRVDWGLVVPIPKFPGSGTNTILLVEIPTEVTPVLFANVGYTGEDVRSWLMTLNALTPIRLEPSP